MSAEARCERRQLVLLRHGESVWNRDNRFTGWTDVDLSDRGKQEALRAGRSLAEHGFEFDIAFTSVLKRAIRTLWLVLDEMGLMWIPVHRDWRLNERHYGALQGLNKAETARKFGERNSLRALVKHLDGVSDPDIAELDIPTGIPLTYELDEDSKPIRRSYLGDAEGTQRVM